MLTFERARGSNAWLVFNSTATVVVLLVFLCTLFVPRWETNDDVAMSMVAHGYGISAVGSPDLMFSNVIWGYFIRSIPPVNGVLGYSIATLLVLFISGSSILYSIQRLGVGRLTSIIAVCLIFLRPIIFPQFTLNAGLLTISAILCLLTYAKTADLGSLVAAGILAFLGFIIRSQEFILVVIVASPMLLSNGLQADKRLRTCFFLLLTAIIFASLWDHFCYTGVEWKKFNDFNLARAPFTDFGAAEQILKHKNILDHYSYSDNDISLIRNFFFADPKIANPAALKSMLADLGPGQFFVGDLKLGVTSVEALLLPEIFPIVLLGISLFLLKPNFRVALSWAIFLTALFAMGLCGRGGILRVDTPVATLLCLASVAQIDRTAKAVHKKQFWRAIDQQSTALCAICACLILNCSVIFPQAIQSERDIRTEQAGIVGFPEDVVVVWGDGLKFESIFPLLANNLRARSIELYSLGVSTYAPFSVASYEEVRGRGFVTRIRSADGLLLIAGTTNMEQLRIWCSERFAGKLEDKVVRAAPLTRIDRVWCVNQ